MAAQKQLERVAKHSDRHLFLKHTLKLCCTERRNQTSKKKTAWASGLRLAAPLRVAEPVLREVVVAAADADPIAGFDVHR